MIDERLTCPGTDRLALLAKTPNDAMLADMAAHVFVCENCRRAFEDVLYPQNGEGLSVDEAEIINEFVKTHCAIDNPFRKLKRWINEHPVLDYAAVDLRWRTAASSISSDDRRHNEPLELVFVSDQTEEESHAWRATLRMESVADPNGVFVVTVEDRTHEAVAECELTICNQRVPIKNGKGELSYQSFVAGLRDPFVKVKFPDGKSTSGTLALF